MSQLNDLIGQRFGRWQVLRLARIVKYKRRTVNNRQTTVSISYWTCECTEKFGGCGTEREVMGSSLTAQQNPSRSCGCLARELSSGRLSNKTGLNAIGSRKYRPFTTRVKSLVGKRFGKWNVLALAQNNTFNGRRTTVRWLVECSCPARTRKSVLGGNLLNGRSARSCGCIRGRIIRAA